MTIGERLKEWRKEKNLTTLEISRKTGISAGGISEYENDKKLIGSKTLISLYKEYNIDITWILTGEKKAHPELQELTEDEKELLENFQKLNERDKLIFIGRLQEAAAAAATKNKFTEKEKNSSVS